MSRSAPTGLWCVCCALVGILIGVAGLGFHRRYVSFRKHGRVFMNCFSDSIVVVKERLASYAHENQGRLPTAAALPDVLGYIPECRSGKMKAPLAINPKLGDLMLSRDRNRLLIWCPTDRHEGYVGALFLREAQITAEVVSLENLAAALERELLQLPGQALVPNRAGQIFAVVENSYAGCFANSPEVVDDLQHGGWIDLELSSPQVVKIQDSFRDSTCAVSEVFAQPAKNGLSLRFPVSESFEDALAFGTVASFDQGLVEVSSSRIDDVKLREDRDFLAVELGLLTKLGE